MQRNQTGLSELGPSNRENAFGPIHILGSEVERLTQPQTRGAHNRKSMDFELPSVRGRTWLKAVETSQRPPLDVSDFGTELPIVGVCTGHRGEALWC
jgi:hypothetical protein